MPDQSHVGRRYQAPGQVLDAAAVARFAQAIAGPDPGAPLGDVPPTYAAVYCLFPTFAQVFLDPEMGLDLTGLVHGEQSFEFVNPPRLGETLDASATVAAVDERRGRYFVRIDVEAHRPDGETVVRGRALLIAPGAATGAAS